MTTRSCPDCGADITDPRRKRCEPCTKVYRNARKRLPPKAGPKLKPPRRADEEPWAPDADEIERVEREAAARRHWEQNRARAAARTAAIYARHGLIAGERG